MLRENGAKGNKLEKGYLAMLYRGKFSADNLRDELSVYVGERLGDEEGGVPDKTGFLKQ